MNREEWVNKGFVDEPVDKSIDLKAAINELKKEKNAVILGHYYQKGEIQDIADYIGDSLALAQIAAKTDADILVMCGVHFMGETAKVLCPDKKVLVPDLNAGCSLADSCPADKFAEFVKAHPGYTVISYVNTTAAVKAVTDVVVTSTNAKQIVESFPKDEKIIFGPDRNLGNYINSITGREMLLWDGACHVHEQFSVEKIVELKAQYPDAVVLDDIRSLHNIGSVFRTADAFRIECIYLCGITATPPHPEMHKTALGAEFTVDWKYVNNAVETVDNLRSEGYVVYSVEQAEGSIMLDELTLDRSKKYAVVMGNEVKGVQQEVIDHSDGCIEIPQYGTKHSLNVSVTAGIVIWDLFKKLK